ncbi:MAG: NADH-quinone oxidoreductase subunit J [candidate division Zixibacteria bacterium]|nr:NADH-quinone oxidoreductase subunit J [candidate division Zixibacteria bacterium]MDH3935692.1 NADH-quinone oxidoreductase subunit J [candidate division Zixibacteria bacterium]MDH4033907.1 NADH-quinone oxidoreductase subunit J [candidate division Zixibacteria bacterium]
MELLEPGIVFWILALVILVSGLLVVTLRNIFHCALCLILCLSAVAGIYILLGAEFLAAAQVLIYVGAVAILIVFTVMLTTDLGSSKTLQHNQNGTIAFVVCSLFAIGAPYLIKETGVWPPAKGDLIADNVGSIGKYLMTDFMLPFEVVSVLLLAALIGAIVLARKERS